MEMLVRVRQFFLICKVSLHFLLILIEVYFTNAPEISRKLP